MREGLCKGLACCSTSIDESGPHASTNVESDAFSCSIEDGEQDACECEGVERGEGQELEETVEFAGGRVLFTSPPRQSSTRR